MITHKCYWRWVFRGHLGAYPCIYMPLERMRRRLLHPVTRDLIVGSRTELVIEGYPRSGNTFAAHAFRLAQGRDVSVATRCHAAAQVLEGIRRNLPCLVLIREPRDAAISAYVLSRGHLTPGFLLRHYVRYYQTLEPHLHRIVVASFSQVSSDFGTVIERLNHKYQTEFRPFVNSDQNVQAVFRSIDEFQQSRTGAEDNHRTVSRPHELRNAMKCHAQREFDKSSIRGLLNAGQELYSHIRTGFAEQPEEAGRCTRSWSLHPRVTGGPNLRR